MITLLVTLIAAAGLCAPVAAWLYYRDAWMPAASVSLPLLIAGIIGIVYVLRLRPLNVMAVTAALMAVSVVCASIWLMPYLEKFKSPRWFSNQVRQIVPPSALVFIYADTRNDFNYYTEREIIPVVPDGSSLDRLLGREKGGYLIITARDLERLPQLTQRSVVVSETNTSSMWHLLKLAARSSSDEN